MLDYMAEKNQFQDHSSKLRVPPLHYEASLRTSFEHLVLEDPQMKHGGRQEGRIYSSTGHYLAMEDYDTDSSDLITDGLKTRSKPTRKHNQSSSSESSSSTMSPSSPISFTEETTNSNYYNGHGSSPNCHGMIDSQGELSTVTELQDALLALKLHNAELSSCLREEKRKNKLIEESLWQERKRAHEERKKRQECEEVIIRDQEYISSLEETVHTLKSSRLIIDPKMYKQIAEKYIASRKSNVRRTCSSGVPGRGYNEEVTCDLNRGHFAQSHCLSNTYTHSEGLPDTFNGDGEGLLSCDYGKFHGNSVDCSQDRGDHENIVRSSECLRSDYRTSDLRNQEDDFQISDNLSFERRTPSKSDRLNNLQNPLSASSSDPSLSFCDVSKSKSFKDSSSWTTSMDHIQDLRWPSDYGKSRVSSPDFLFQSPR